MKNLRSVGMMLCAFVVGFTLQFAQANEPRPFTASKTVDLASLIDAAGATENIVVPGAAIGDFCNVSMGVSLQGITATCWIATANNVSVRFQNESASTVDLASTTMRVEIRRSPQF